MRRKFISVFSSSAYYYSISRAEEMGCPGGSFFVSFGSSSPVTIESIEIVTEEEGRPPSPVV